MFKHALAGLVAAAGLALATTASADIFQSAHAPGMCLNASTGGVSIQPCDGSANQDLAVVSASGGRVLVAGLRCLRMAGQNNMPELVNCNAPSWSGATRFSTVNNGPIVGDGLCLDIKSGKKSAGTRVIGYPCNGQNNQRWVRTVTGKTPSDNIQETVDSVQDGKLSLNHAPYLCLSVASNGLLHTRPCNTATKFKMAVGVPATPVRVPGGKCLDPNGSQGQQIRTMSGNCGANSALWTFTSNGLLRSSNGLCADVESASNSPNARVIFYKCSGSSNQRFTLFN